MQELDSSSISSSLVEDGEAESQQGKLSAGGGGGAGGRGGARSWQGKEGGRSRSKGGRRVVTLQEQEHVQDQRAFPGRGKPDLEQPVQPQVKHKIKVQIISAIFGFFKILFLSVNWLLLVL